MTDKLTETIVQYKKARAQEIEEQKCIRAMERKKRQRNVSVHESDAPITVTQKDTVMFVDKRYNVRNYRKMLKNESLQLTKKELAKALNSEGEAKNEEHMMECLRKQQEKEQKVLHLFGFVNKNRFMEVEAEEEAAKPVEKAKIKNK